VETLLNCATATNVRRRYKGLRGRESGGSIGGRVGRRFFEKLKICFGSVDGSLGSASITG